MLRATQMKNTTSAKEYLMKGLAKSDYYIEGTETISTWNGKSAILLGLNSHELKKDDFNYLCDGLNPNTGHKLIQRIDTDRRPFYDFTFSVPKSVSIVWALNEDERILNATERAVNATLNEMERYVETRDQKDGKNEYIRTNNMIYSKFMHYTTRPEKGVVDMHLHYHVPIFNVTFDPKNEKWKTIEYHSLIINRPMFQEMFNNELAKNLQSIGYELRQTKDNFEITQIPRETIETFSTRTKAINKFAEEHEIFDPTIKGQLGAKTRSKKENIMNKEELWKSWSERIKPEERTILNDLERNLNNSERNPNDLERLTNQAAVQAAIEYGLQKNLERKTTVSFEQVITDTLKYSTLEVTYDEVKKELQRKIDSKEILEIKEKRYSLLSTQEVLKEEKNLIKMYQNSKGIAKPLNTDYQIPELKTRPLADEQKAAIKHVLTSDNYLTVIQGRAGAGKTTTLKELERGVNASGKDMFAFAPTKTASHDVLRNEGFSNADTVQQFLINKNLQTQAARQVVVIDEAGLLGTRDLHRLMQLQKQHEFHLVLVGDVRQHAPVERGDALRILESNGLEYALLMENRRQTEVKYKEVVNNISVGKTSEAIKLAKENEMLIEKKTPSKAHDNLAKEYVKKVKSYEGLATAKNKVLVVSPTHEEEQKVTNKIRKELKRHKLISNHDHKIVSLVPLHLTHAEKVKPNSYQEDMILQFHNSTDLYKRNERYKVKMDSVDLPYLINSKDEVLPVPYKLSDKFSVYKQEEINITKGDLIQITQNRVDLKGENLNNGQIYRIKDISKEGKITLDNDKLIDQNFGNLKHGYVSTSYSSQGKTVDHCFISQTSLSIGASSQQQAYVSSSRGRLSLKWFTDDAKNLQKIISKDQQIDSITKTIRKANKLEKNL